MIKLKILIKVIKNLKTKLNNYQKELSQNGFFDVMRLVRNISLINGKMKYYFKKKEKKELRLLFNISVDKVPNMLSILG